jgi:endonuclease YncB( thermonuclease family)
MHKNADINDTLSVSVISSSENPDKFMKQSLKTLSFVFILALLSSPLHAQQTTTAVRVVDGDTLKVRYWGKEESIRLIGIDHIRKQS